MADAPRHPGPRRLGDQLARWVGAGVISEEQADAIARLESGQPGEALPVLGDVGGPHGEGRLPLLAEALAYLGVILVTVSGAFVVVRFWGDLLVGGRLAVGVVVAILGLGAGFAVGGRADPAARRLGSFLSLCGTGGVAIVAGVSAVALGSHSAEVTALAVGLAVLSVSSLLWRNRDRPLPFLSSLAGAVTAVVGLVNVVQLTPTPAQAGTAVWVAGMGLGALGWWHVVHPSPPAVVIGALGALGGALAIADRYQGFGMVLGLATAGVAVLAGVVGKEYALAGAGIAGFLVFLSRTLAIYVQGTASALSVLVLGIILVALALRHWHHRGGTHPPSKGGDTTSLLHH